MIDRGQKVLYALLGSILFISCTFEVGWGQEDRFPSKIINLLIGVAAGSSGDVPTRALAKAAEKSLGQPILCTNVPGAGGARALGQMVKAKPDGYTLATLNLPAVMSSIVEKVNYSIPDDFSPVIQFSAVPFPFVVKKDAPWKTWKEFVQDARERKGGTTVAVLGSKSAHWLVLRQIEKRENIKFVYAPYAGGGESAAAILGGHVTASTIVSSIVYAKTGELRLLMVFSDHRLRGFPDVPTAKELYGAEGVAFGGGNMGIAGPRGVPKAIVTKLHDAFKKGMEDPEFMKGIENIDLTISYRTSDEFRIFLKGADAAGREYLKEEGK